MKRLPMSAESMRAILAGAKTLTSRVVVPQPTFDGCWWNVKGTWTNTELGMAESLPFYAPYHVGERVALTETWRATDVLPGPDCDWFEYRVEHRAGGYARWVRLSDVRSRELSVVPCLHAPWVPAFLMPAEFSRQIVVITSVDAGRLHDMTDEDYRREGVETLSWFKGDLRAAYMAWWDRLNAKRGFPASMNPWRYSYGFREER